MILILALPFITAVRIMEVLKSLKYNKHRLRSSNVLLKKWNEIAALQ